MTRPYKSRKFPKPSPLAAISRPKHGTLIACIASLSGTLERELGGILGDVLEIHSKQALAMYLALSGTQARKSALLAAAKLRIGGEDYAELVKLYKTIHSKALERNNVIHGAWALSDDEPDSLLLGDSAEYVQFEASILDLASHHWSDDPQMQAKQLQKFSNKLIAIDMPSYTVYEISDLKRIAYGLGDLVKLVHAFREKLQNKYRWRSPAP